MPRSYKPKPGGKTYKKYDQLIFEQALKELECQNKTLNMVAQKYNISKSVLYRHKNRIMKPHGGQTVLSKEIEEYIVNYLNISAEWGYPLDTTDLRYIVKMYLDSTGITSNIFKNNFPGPDFVAGFLKRHKDKISTRICQNIKRSRAAVSPDKIKEYFGELQISLEGVPNSNILNYDETNLADDPGRKKVIVRRGCKYPERVKDQTKGSVSLMMAGTADGEMLPPYVVYKSTYLYNTWMAGGPTNARYNRTSSGWFDGGMFADWIKTMVIPFFENKEGKKLLIGDNLSSHLSVEIIKLCKENNIHFVFLPPNSTHLTQPLDVAFFRPMKVAWRQLLDNWKKTDGRTMKSVPKGCFPRLLRLLIDKISENSNSNIRAGFRKTGIVPFNVNTVLERLPQEKITTENDKEIVDEAFVNLLKEMRYGTMNITEPKRKRKVDVIAGRSVSEKEERDIDFPVTKTKRYFANLGDLPSTSNSKTCKGKGVGKRTKTTVGNQGKRTDEQNETNKMNATEQKIKTKNYNQNREVNSIKEMLPNNMQRRYRSAEDRFVDLENKTEKLYDVEMNNETREFKIVKEFIVLSEQKYKTKEITQNNYKDLTNENSDTISKPREIELRDENTDGLSSFEPCISQQEQISFDNNVSILPQTSRLSLNDNAEGYIFEENPLNIDSTITDELENNYLADIDINSLPIILSEEFDVEKEVFITTDGPNENLPDEKRSSKADKIHVISDIKLSLPLPKFHKSATELKSKKNASTKKNYYNRADEIMKILEEDI